MMNMMKKDFSMGSIAVNMIVNMEMMKNLIGLLPKNLQKVAKWGMYYLKVIQGEESSISL